MKTLTKTILAVTFGLLATAPVYAGHGHSQDRVSERMERQQHRIEQGIESRELTPKEAKILKKQHRRLHRLVREFREDGRLSKRERRILQRKLDKSSRQIKELKHNRLNRYVDWHKSYGDCCDRAIDQSDWRKGEHRTQRDHKRQAW
jgi:hypothetical protein